VASKKAIREHIERVEYLKETARRKLEKLILDTPPLELARGNTVRLARQLTKRATEELSGEIVEAFKEARAWSATTGMEQLTQKEAQAIADQVVREWSAAFQSRTTKALRDIQNSFARDVGRGVSNDQIKKALESGTLGERVQKDIAQKVKPMGNSLSNDIGSRVRDEALGKSPGLFTWITTQSDNVCEDSFDSSCAPRHDVTMTVKEWREVGLPGSAILLCSSFRRVQCQCDLVAASAKEADLYERVNISEAIAKGKKRAAANFKD